jgi:hypothetical protein
MLELRYLMLPISRENKLSFLTRPLSRFFLPKKLILTMAQNLGKSLSKIFSALFCQSKNMTRHFSKCCKNHCKRHSHGCIFIYTLISANNSQKSNCPCTKFHDKKFDLKAVPCVADIPQV